jgi:D-alanine-D-alanine ligase
MTMRIALTHNLRLSDAEDEAEYDSRETVDALAGAIERLGHRVERIEVSGPASRTVARLEAYGPDLIFNTAEGRRGRFREAFFPALFDELAMPYTGSDAYALSVTLDKQLTKLVLAQHGITTPRWQFIEDPQRLQTTALRFPVIVKPNFEGSSKGITQDSVIEDPVRLHEAVNEGLRRYPAGLLVEEFIPGRDVTVPFLEAAAEERGGVLQPVEYAVAGEAGPRRWAIYDYELKTRLEQLVSVQAPAKLTRAQATRTYEMARTVLEVLGIRDLGRIDFRVGEDGEVYFLEINALPSLEPGAGIYVSAALEGLHADGVIGAVIESAVRRWKIEDQRARRGRPRRTGRLKVGFAFNVKRVKPDLAGEQDEEAEYDSPKTLQAIREAIASYGHDVIDLEATSDLPLVLASTPVDVVFNIAEGFKGRNRESQIPALLELLDIPYTGSDPAALSVSLDKALAKRMIRTHGILTPDYLLMQNGKERLPRELAHFPLIVKPVAEGTSKGVTKKSVVGDEAELREVAREIIAKYRQPALVEDYITGREFTVGLLGERRPRVLPPMEVVFLDQSDPTPVYSFEMKQEWNDKIRYEVPAKLTPRELDRIEKAARECFVALGCRDVARVDFRMDAEGKVYFIESNPLPGLAPGWSDLVLIAQAAGIEYRALIGEILSFAIRRYQERERERERARRAQIGAGASAGQASAGGNVSNGHGRRVELPAEPDSRNDNEGA